MSISDELRNRVMAQAQGATALNLAFIGVANGLFSKLAELGQATPEMIAETVGVDAAYVARWCDAAYAFGYLDETDGHFRLTDLGDAFRPEVPGSLMPMAVGSALGAHMAERAATFMKTGERPGERVLGERESILPWFGPMLEASFGGIFESQILPGVPVYQQVDEQGGVAVDLGCGNGWYLRRLAAHYPHLRGVGLDGFDENIQQASRLAERDGVADRLSFRSGDIHQFTLGEPVDLIAMNRALHHVWSDKDNVFRILKEHLKPGGAAVIWEPHWPKDRAALREPSRRGMAVQNLAEHVQGNHFLRPEEIQAEFRKFGMDSEVYLFGIDGSEAVVVGTRP